MENLFQKLYSRMDHSITLQCIRSGLVMMIPVLLTGSFALMLRSLPIAGYEEFITTFFSGVIDRFLALIYHATFGFLAVYMTISIGVSYAEHKPPAEIPGYGQLVTSLCCFCIFSGVFSGDFSMDVFGANGMFTAIVCAIGGSVLYNEVEERLPRFAGLYADGADNVFRNAVSAIIPSVIVILVFAVVNIGIGWIFDGNSFQDVFVNSINKIFADTGRLPGTALLFVFVRNVLWFFGIHGDNVLEPVTQNLFVPALDINLELVRSGEAATEIFCKPFFDVFVAMGGCGTSICLLLALLLFGKRRSDRNFARFSALPMLFNINEIIMFGLPVVFNPILLIPFIVTPLVMVLTSSLAMYMGLVPIPIANVEWTTPVLIGGYLATGSISGSVLQIVNIIIGVLIYRPFIRIHDEQSSQNSRNRMDELVELYRQSEEACRPVDLLTLNDSLGGVSRTLAEDLVFRLQSQLPSLFYQPQYNDCGKCIGAEALLRWSHPLYGTVYPPMLIKLAEETGQLDRLERAVYKAVIHDMDQLLSVLGEDAKISVNVSGITIQTEEFEEFLRGLQQENQDACRHICIEITEQTALQINDVLIRRLSRIHDMGYMLAIDDFSMGSTSIKYLQSSVFDLVKLDGGLSRDIVNNTRSRDIVASIAGLSNNFGIGVLAEYVETEEQRKILKGAGCLLYQGYLYSSAVPIDQLEEVIREKEEKMEV